MDDDETIPIEVFKMIGHKKYPTREMVRCSLNNIDPAIDLLSRDHTYYFIKATNQPEINILYVDGTRHEESSYCTRCRIWFNSSGSNRLVHVANNHQQIEKNTIVVPSCDKNFDRFKTLFLYFIRHHIPLYSYNDPVLIPNLFPNFPGLPSFLNLLYNTADYLKERIMNEILEVEKIGLIIDGWTDQSQRRFIGISIFYIYNSGIVTRFLSFSNLSELSHTADAIAKEIMTVAERFSFDISKVEVIISDSASTMKATSVKLGVHWMPCFLHLFNLCFNKFWDYSPAIAKDCIRMCNSLHKKPKFVDFLIKEKEHDPTISVRNINTFSKTRWISLASTVQSILSLSTEITKFFSEVETNAENADNDETDIDDDFFKQTEVQDPFELNSPVTLDHLNSLVDIGGYMKLCELSFEQIKKALLHDPGTFYTELEILLMITEDTLTKIENEEWKKSIEEFKKGLTERFLDENNDHIKPIMIMHLLDLNHRVTRLFEDTLINDLKNLIISDLLDIEENDAEQPNQNDNEDTQEISEYEQFARASQTYSSDVDMSGRLREEVDLFFAWKKRRVQDSHAIFPLYWLRQENGVQNRFPRLFKVFQHYRLYLGTSITMENTFSISRRILRWDRMKMSIEKVQELMLVTMNQDLAVNYLCPGLATKFLEKYYSEIEGRRAPTVEEISNIHDLSDIFELFHVPFPNHYL